MGILTNALSIVLGGLFGNRLQRKYSAGNFRTLGISIMILSLVGFLENMYNVQGNRIASENLVIVLISFLLGSKIGESLHLEDRLSALGSTASTSLNAFIDTSLFFGIGGLQLSGPIALAINGDSSQLFIKSFVDFPFAIAFGAAYGKIAALSAIPVAAIQLLIVLIASLCASVFTPVLTAQLCALGYVILFFSGFNLMTDSAQKISNINMLPSIFLIVLMNILIQVTEIFV